MKAMRPKRATESQPVSNAIPPRRWYHLTLFPKFALIFFLVVAIPVVVIVQYSSQRNRTLVVRSIDQITPQVVGFIEEITQSQLRDYDEILDGVNREMRAYLEGMATQKLLSSEEQGDILTMFSTTLQDRRTRAWQQAVERQTGFHHTVKALVSKGVLDISGKIVNRTRLTMLPMMFLVGLFSAGIGILVAGYIIRPIRQITAIASQIARGEVHDDIPVIRSHDEIGQLSRSFQDMTAYIRRMVTSAQQIAEGDFTHDIAPRAAHDALGAEFQHMIAYLRDLSAFATAISYGDIRQKVSLKSASDVLGQAIQRMTDYLQGIARMARTVANGNLSEQVTPQSGEDVLGKAFADMVVNLREIVASIRRDANTLVSMSQEAHNRAEEEAASVEKISLSVEETSSAMTQMAMSIGEVHNNMQGLASFVGETSSSIEEMTSSIRQIVRHSGQLTAASEETSVSIEEISASLQQFAKTAQHSKRLSDAARQDAINGREVVEEMIQGMLGIQIMASETAEVIRSLHDRTESIQDILSVIKDISDQTALLAINTSIIAKKAGEHGRGFTVIADKVRKLAERSNTSAKEIALIIRAFRKEAAQAVAVVSQGQGQVQAGVRLAELTGQALEKIISGANESSSVVSMIADATGEQTTISRHIRESMEQVMEMVEHIKQATTEQEKSSAYIMKQSEQILLASEQVKAATSEQADVVKHVTLTMDDVRNLIQMTAERATDSARAASALADHAGALQHLVSQFTT